MNKEKLNYESIELISERITAAINNISEIQEKKQLDFNTNFVLGLVKQQLEDVANEIKEEKGE